MFENLHDTDPPTPGLHQFARVAERARQIRRRRARTAMWATMAGIVVVAGVGVWAADPPHRSATPAADVSAPTFPEYAFADAGEITGLPPLDLAGQPVGLPIGDNQLAEVSEGAGGAVCVSLHGSNPVCSSPGRGFHFATAADTTVIVVAAEVDVAFLAVGAECSSAPLMGLTVHVWRCTGLDTSRARIRVLGPTQILIAVPSG